MYNRYIPSADGTYHRQSITNAELEENQPEPAVLQAAHDGRPAFSAVPTIDNNDLLLLAVFFLILQNSDEADRMSTLITLAAFLLLR